MHYGFVIPGGDVETLVDVARQIEDAGWDGAFVADGVYGTDPWVSLAAMAVHTRRIRLGTLLTPASRRRPWKLASEAATLDRLSHGRVVLPVGLGAINTGFDQVGEQTDRAIRAQLLDECLEIVTGFWSGQPFHYDGVHYHVHWDNSWSYVPVQTPRIPIWVVGAWPRRKSLLRALRYDGLIAVTQHADGSMSSSTPADIQDIRRFADEQRVEKTSFDIVVEGVTPLDAPEQGIEIVSSYAKAGATWWIESMWDVPGGLDVVLARIKQGPPRI